MRFDVYGLYLIEVIRESAGWRVYRCGEGKRSPLPDISIPAEIDEAALETYLDDLFHELARPGRRIRRID